VPRASRSKKDSSPFTPLKMTEDARRSLSTLMEGMRRRADYDLAPLRDRCKLWRELYEGSSEVIPAFEGGSHIFFPIAATIGDAAHSKMMQSTWGSRDPIIVSAPIQEGDYSRMAEGASLYEDLGALARALNSLLRDPAELDGRGATDAIYMEQIQVGTAIVRVFHDIDETSETNIRKMNGEIERVSGKRVRNRIRIRIIPLEQCFWDTTASDKDCLSFIGFDYTLTSREIQAKTDWNDGQKAKVLASPDYQPTDQQTDASRREHVNPPSHGDVVEIEDSTGKVIRVSPFARYTLSEVWLVGQDVDGDGANETAVITWHRTSAAVPLVSLCPYAHNESALHVLPYAKRAHRLIGRPPLEGNESLCAGMNAIINQAIDAQTVRNVPTVIGPDTGPAQEKLESDRWRPGIYLPERNQGEVRFAEFAQSGNTVVSLSIADKITDVMHRRAHLGPAQFGDVSVAQRTPGGLGTAIMAEGAAPLDKIIGDNRVSLGRIFRQAVFLIQQLMPEKWAETVGPEDAEKINRVFDIIGMDKLKIDILVASAARNRESDLQANMQLSQVVGQHTEKLIQFLMMLGGTPGKDGQPIPPSPLVLAVAPEIIKTQHKMMQLLVESFPTIDDVDTVVPDIEKALVDKMQPPPEQPPQGMGMPPGGMPPGGMPEQGGPPPGMPMPGAPPEGVM